MHHLPTREIDNFGVSRQPGPPKLRIWIWGYDENHLVRRAARRVSQHWLATLRLGEKDRPNGHFQCPAARTMRRR